MVIQGYGPGAQGGGANNKKSALEVSGESDYLQGQKLPGVFKQANKQLDKIHEDKKRLKGYY